MPRAASPVLCLVLLTGCTAPSPAPAPAPEPTVSRSFAVLGSTSPPREQIRAISDSLEPHGISCSFEGSLSSRADCAGTERQWTQAEAAVDRLIADGIVKGLGGEPGQK